MRKSSGIYDFIRLCFAKLYDSIHFVSQSSFRRPRLPPGWESAVVFSPARYINLWKVFDGACLGRLVQNSAAGKNGTPGRPLVFRAQIDCPHRAQYRGLDGAAADFTALIWHAKCLSFARNIVEIRAKERDRERFCSRANSNRSNGIQARRRILPRFAPA